MQMSKERVREKVEKRNRPNQCGADPSTETQCSSDAIQIQRRRERGEVSGKEVKEEKKLMYKEESKRERQQDVENIRNTLVSLKSLEQLYHQLGKQRCEVRFRKLN